MKSVTSRIISQTSGLNFRSVWLTLFKLHTMFKSLATIMDSFISLLLLAKQFAYTLNT
jgi:hypothetical protein